MRLLNLTPHSVTIVTDAGTVEIPPSGEVARVAAEYADAGDLSFDGQTVPVKTQRLGNPSGLPEPEADTMYLVSAMVRQAAPWRADLLSPGELIRDEKGQPTGCRFLVANRAADPTEGTITFGLHPRDRADRALLVGPDRSVRLWDGESIPGLVASRMIGCTKEGKWSSRSYGYRLVPGARIIPFVPAWETRRAGDGLAAVLGVERDPKAIAAALGVDVRALFAAFARCESTVQFWLDCLREPEPVPPPPPPAMPSELAEKLSALGL